MIMTHTYACPTCRAVHRIEPSLTAESGIYTGVLCKCGRMVHWPDKSLDFTCDCGIRLMVESPE